MLSKSLARLSSGSKLDSPGDDSAGMAVSMRFDAQINRTAAANANVGNAISFSQTQEGFLKKVAKALDRMSELAVLAQDVTKTDADRSLYNTEYGKLGAYVADLGTKTFNGVALFSSKALSVTTDSDTGTFSAAGANTFLAAAATATDSGVAAVAAAAAVSAVAFAAASPGSPAVAAVDAAAAVAAVAAISAGAGLGTTAGAAYCLSKVKLAITALANDRSVVGSNISVLSSYSEQLAVQKDNLSAANSRIKDVDVAEESTKFARYNILVQAGTAMLAQANTGPQSALRLLQ